MQRLWTPWRMRYVSGETRDDTCIFCAKPTLETDVEQLILHRERDAYVIMNLYPYNSGHLMIVPFQHAGDLSELAPDVASDVFGMIPWTTECLRRVLRPDGFNIGLNVGDIAGAGVADHLHVHVVPRWKGDANFMPVIANTMVLPELLPVTYAKLRAEFEISATGDGPERDVTIQAGAIPLLTEDGTIALRRAADGSIVLPKGHVEPGEAAFETAIRELDEEMGLIGEPLDWGGVLEFEVDGRGRRVVYLIVRATPGVEFEIHFGSDTVALPPAEAVDALTHEPARGLLRSLLPLIDEIMSEAS